MPETPEPEFVALLAIDWADRKHVFVVEDRNGRRRRGEIEQRPEAVEAFGAGPIAVALGQSRGALIELLRKYDQIAGAPPWQTSCCDSE